MQQWYQNALPQETPDLSSDTRPFLIWRVSAGEEVKAFGGDAVRYQFIIEIWGNIENGEDEVLDRCERVRTVFDRVVPTSGFSVWTAGAIRLMSFDGIERDEPWIIGRTTFELYVSK